MVGDSQPLRGAHKLQAAHGSIPADPAAVVDMVAAADVASSCWAAKWGRGDEHVLVLALPSVLNAWWPVQSSHSDVAQHASNRD